MLVDKPGSHYDTVIVGTGPAGITVARELAKRGKDRILLIESGTEDPANAAQEFSRNLRATGDYAAEQYPVHAQRVLGGTSSVWAGYCAALEERSFRLGLWPIEYETLHPYYLAATQILELPPEAATAPSTSIPGIDTIVYRPYYLSPPVRFGARFGDELKAHERIDLLMGYTCKDLVLKEGRISAITLSSSENADETMTVIAPRYVIACGGLGNPALLESSGVTSSDALGRYFMMHPHIPSVGRLSLRQDVFDKIVYRETRAKHALSLGDDFCIKNDVLNVSLQFKPDDKRLQWENYMGRRQAMYVTDCKIRAEMAPLSSNRIRIDRGIERRGIPGWNINFSFQYIDMARKAVDLFAEELLRSRLGRLEQMSEDDTPIKDGGGHYIGTTRMGLSVEDSVVDSNCKVHGVDNLFVAGSSVFPAAAAANPTFSIVAFALRLADHLSS